jgi:hypothetical protein
MYPGCSFAGPIPRGRLDEGLARLEHLAIIHPMSDDIGFSDIGWATQELQSQGRLETAAPSLGCSALTHRHPKPVADIETGVTPPV